MQTKKIMRRAVKISADAFSNTAAAITAAAVPDWLREFFEIDSDPRNPLDLSNPDRDLVLGTSDGTVFEPGYDTSGPFLDLG
jgi:hypothetical protein